MLPLEIIDHKNNGLESGDMTKEVETFLQELTLARHAADASPDMYAHLVEFYEEERIHLLAKKVNQKDSMRLYQVNIIIRHIQHDTDDDPEGISYGEIAKMMGCSKSSPAELVRKGVRTLRRRLNKKGRTPVANEN